MCAFPHSIVLDYSGYVMGSFLSSMQNVDIGTVFFKFVDLFPSMTTGEPALRGIILAWPLCVLFSAKPSLCFLSTGPLPSHSDTMQEGLHNLKGNRYIFLRC